MKTCSSQEEPNSNLWMVMIGMIMARTFTVATIGSSAPGLLGVIGFTTTTTVALPVAGIVAAGGLATYGAIKVIKWLND